MFVDIDAGIGGLLTVKDQEGNTEVFIPVWSKSEVVFP